jgi:hypothetical protein
MQAGAVDSEYLLPATFPGFSMSDLALWSVDRGTSSFDRVAGMRHPEGVIECMF